MSEDPIRSTPSGLACEAGGFHVDPWRPVETALVTHAHADHLVAGCGRYLCAAASVPLLRRRLPPGALVEGLAWREGLALGGVEVALHPAGHVLGSAQVRIDGPAGRWVVTGDWKRASDPTCDPFEVVPCDGLVTEATFALPLFRWRPPGEVARELLAWWDACRAAGRCAVLYAYALGKAQRVLAELARLTDRTVHLHGAVAAIVELYRQAGVRMLPTELVVDRPAERAPRGRKAARSFAGELVIAPPSAHRSPWLRRLGDVELGLASGWMRLRGQRRRRGMDRGFVLSDHADWPALVDTIRETGARRVLVTHGHAEPLVRFLRERGASADALATEYTGEGDFHPGALEPDAGDAPERDPA